MSVFYLIPALLTGALITQSRRRGGARIELLLRNPSDALPNCDIIP
jgi:hypothetical protein